MAGLITGIAGLAITAGTTAYSFAQANKEKNKQLQYENEANKALAEAKKALQVNYARQMSIKKEPYNQERMALLNQGAMITQSAAESDRGAASAAGQIYAGQQMGQANITDRQSNDLTNIENAILEEDSRLRDVGVGLDTMELQGAQQAAADARLASQQAMQAGIEGVANTTQQVIAMPDLYSGSKSKDANPGYSGSGSNGANPGSSQQQTVTSQAKQPMISQPQQPMISQAQQQLTNYQGQQLPLYNNQITPMWQQNANLSYNPFNIYRQ